MPDKKLGTLVHLPDMKVYLPNRASYTRRWSFFETMFYLPGRLAVGVLEIWQSVRDKPEMSRYLVEELDPKVFGSTEVYSRCFRLFLSQAKSEETEWYAIELEEDPEGDCCDCRGFVSHMHCKHLDSMRSLFNAGAFPPRGQQPGAVLNVPEFTPAALRAGIPPAPAPQPARKSSIKRGASGRKRKEG